MHLTRGADESAIKRQLIGAVARFCEEAGVALIVEGIETTDELAAVEDLGIHLLQGYLFGPPASAPGKEVLTLPPRGGPREPTP
jgi:EAL domain-containing protein (putative c-di-GMP-specific phosphodiesterase class I)